MKPLRLCYVGPANSVSLRRWVEWFAARGHETTIVTVEPAEPALVGKFRQIDVGGWRGPRKVSRALAALRMVLAVNRLRPDVVHVHYVRGLAWGLRLNKRSPCILTPWGSDILEEQGAFKEWYSKGLTRGLFGIADLVTVHSEYLGQRVHPLVRPGCPVVHVGWGVDLRSFRPGLDVLGLRQQWEIAADRRVIFSTRLAQPFYRLDRIIKALPIVCRNIPDALLVIAELGADPAYLAELRRLASDLGVADRVRFLGSIPYEVMSLWYNLADVVVMVPPSDGMPNSLLEAMACGAVPILSRLPQYSEMVTDGVNGFLVDAGEAEIGAAIVAVLSDPRLRERIGTTNRTWTLERGDQEREMSRMESWYETLASPESGHQRNERAWPCAG